MQLRPGRLSTWLVLSAVIPAFPRLASAQEMRQAQTQEFVIVVTTKGNVVEFTCANRCAWTRLSFDLNDGDRPVAVDQFGMTGTRAPKPESQPKLEDFRFTVERNGKALHFRGENSTASTSLKFSCVGIECTQVVRRRG